MKNKILDKRGNVAAFDVKYTGEEPSWSDASSLAVDVYYARLTRALGFYAYYCDSGSLLPFVTKWMAENGYSKTDVTTISSAPNYTLTSTIGKLCRMLQRGMPDLHPDAASHWKKFETEEQSPQPRSASNIIREEIDRVLPDLKLATMLSAVEKPKKVTVNPHERMIRAVEGNILPELESWLDGLCDITSDITPSKINGCDIASVCRAHNVPAAGLSPIKAWIARHAQEFQEAYDKECPQLVQAYSWLSRAQLRKIIEIFSGMSESLVQYGKIKAGTRKPRVKKPKAAATQVNKLNYARDSKEYNIASVDPTRIPFAQRLYLFNTKNKQLLVYYAQNASGFSVKGSTLLNYEPSSSYAISCRKPQDVLANVISMTDKKLDKALEALTTKKKAVNGRINSNMIIIKTSETR
jgi:hypothetical protein